MLISMRWSTGHGRVYIIRVLDIVTRARDARQQHALYHAAHYGRLSHPLQELFIHARLIAWVEVHVLYEGGSLDVFV